MTNRYPPPPPDEPVIGGGYAPRTALPGNDEPVIGAGPAPYAPPAAPEWADEYDTEDSEYDEYGYDQDGYMYPEEPPRSPLIYVGIGALVVLLFAAVIGAFAIFGNGGDGDDAAAGFNVRIDAPIGGETVEVGAETEIAAQASSNEALVRAELLVDGSVADSQDVAEPAAGVVTRLTFRYTFTERGERTISVRVISESGASKDSPGVKVLVVEPITNAPVEIEGDVLAAVNARTGPGDQYPAVGSLRAGETVTIRGKSRDLEWLLVDSTAGDGLWVRKNSINPHEALALVPVREPTATPAPSATNEPSPSPSETATPDGSLPDLLPAGAVLVEGGGKLQVTVLNNSGNKYAGGLVVSVSGITGGSLTQAFSVDIPANGSAAVLLDVPAISEQKVARVTVDPDNAVKEGAEDNNAANFTVNPLKKEPKLSVSYTVGGGAVTAEVGNSGGDLEPSDLEVCVTVKDDEGAQSSKCVSDTRALAGGQTTSFTISSPPRGTGLLTLSVAGVPTASTSIKID